MRGKLSRKSRSRGSRSRSYDAGEMDEANDECDIPDAEGIIGDCRPAYSESCPKGGNCVVLICCCASDCCCGGGCRTWVVDNGDGTE